MALSLAELILLSLVIDYVFRKIRIPGLVGMLTGVFHMFPKSNFITCPIVNSHGAFVAIIRLEDLRPLLLSHHALKWLIAGDVCLPLETVPQPVSSLADALKIMTKERLRETPVIEAKTHRAAGLLNHETAERYVQEKWLELNREIPLHLPEKNAET